MFHNYEFYPATWVNSGMFKTICAIAYDLCQIAESFLADSDPDINSPIASKVFFGHFPSGSSLKEAEHFT